MSFQTVKSMYITPLPSHDQPWRQRFSEINSLDHLYFIIITSWLSYSSFMTSARDVIDIILRSNLTTSGLLTWKLRPSWYPPPTNWPSTSHVCDLNESLHVFGNLIQSSYLHSCLYLVPCLSLVCVCVCVSYTAVHTSIVSLYPIWISSLLFTFHTILNTV